MTTVWNDDAYTSRLADVSWMANTAVLMHLNERATGDPARNWLSSWAHRYFAGERLRVLVLGCGEGWLERAIADWPFVDRIDAVDFAADAVERARDTVRAEGIANIDYGVVDLNSAELPRDAYDVVVAHSVLHHVGNLEHAYAQIDRAMRPSATFIVNEYVGPNRFQFSDRVLAIMNDLFRCLPEEQRRPYNVKTRPTVDEMIANDPTEAVRAEELIPFTEHHFEILERKDLGGTILQHLLYEIIQNFRFDVPRERSMLEILCTIEAMLVDRGTIPSDFALLAARKRGASVRPVNRPLPPRPDEARDVDPDPLRHAGTALQRPRETNGSSARGEWAPALKLLRLAFASQQPRRANLLEERPLYSWRERLLAHGDPWSWIVARCPDDPPIRALLETAATLART